MKRSASPAIRVRACAKVNLTLRVLGIRADGYHELRTTFQSLLLHDTLLFSPARGSFAITSDDPRCPTDRSNLVWQAAIRLWQAAGRPGEPGGVGVHIRKRIPMEAGLGGGSSDAAAALRALRELWRLRMEDDAVGQIARELGADVPFFLEGGTVLGLDRGDLLFPLQDVPPAWVVLARPDFGVSTREAYGWWNEAWRARAGQEPPAPRRREEWVNDLQGPVAQRSPRIGELVRKLTRSGAHYAAMSGSGSAVFGLYAERDRAQRAADALKGPGLETWLTRTLTRREYARAASPARI